MPQNIKRVKLSIQGLLQGIGFRPFVYRIALEMGLTGWIKNSPQGVSIEAEGNSERLVDFLERLHQKRPSQAILHDIAYSYLEPCAYETFEILESSDSGDQTTSISPDIATCTECLKELFDPDNRRYLYPFTNCSQCGPRYSIIKALPYDRKNTSMNIFKMCRNCSFEYSDPMDRRFHAQPNACPECGPHLEFWDSSCISLKEEAISDCVKALQGGAIVAVKGLGGFHLMVNACDDKAIRRLRYRKHRKEKPFALMFPNLKEIQETCYLTHLEEQALLSPEAPIVLLKRNERDLSAPDCENISNEAAPASPNLGAMLPYTPLHHILSDLTGLTLVATSGNISEETICTQTEEAFSRLDGIADFFLVHNRPIVRHVDDSIVRIISNKKQILRRARGYAPLPISFKDNRVPILGVGGFLKNTVAFSKDKNIFVSQHIGDLGNMQTETAFEDVMQSLGNLYNSKTDQIACDFHPDYPSTQWAERHHKKIIPVQHHVAHVFSCMAEHGLKGPLLGVAWDGSGYGLDSTLWGGEFFHINPESINRFACWRPFPLPGADVAIKEPRRSALGLLFSIFGENAFDRPEIKKSFSQDELSILKSMLVKQINCPQTSSCGRLFDAVSSLTGLRHINKYEGQAGEELENSINFQRIEDYYPVDIQELRHETQTRSNNKKIPSNFDLNLKYQLNPTSLVRELLNDIAEGCSPAIMSAKFHNALAESIVTVAKLAGERRALLSGGCFQNKYLSERTVVRLLQEGYEPFWHQKIPPNDGGLAVGQIYAAEWFEKNRGEINVPGDSR